VAQEVLVDVTEFVAGDSPVEVPRVLTAAIDIEAQAQTPAVPLEALLPQPPESPGSPGVSSERGSLCSTALQQVGLLLSCPFLPSLCLLLHSLSCSETVLSSFFAGMV
jgi:hypothetical protein